MIAADLENKIQGDSARKIYFAQGVYCVSTEAGDRKTANLPGMRSVGCQGIMEAEAQEMDTFRIHGDNIVECERIMSVIVNTLKPSAVLMSLVSPSTLSVRLETEFRGRSVNWRFELLPVSTKIQSDVGKATFLTRSNQQAAFLTKRRTQLLHQ